MLKKVNGMARLMLGYSKVKKLQSKGLSLEDISEIFSIDHVKLADFIEISDALASGQRIFSIEILDEFTVNQVAELNI